MEIELTDLFLGDARSFLFREKNSVPDVETKLIYMNHNVFLRGALRWEEMVGTA